MDVFAPYEQVKQQAHQHTANRAQTFDAAMRAAVDALMAQPQGRVLLRWLLHLCRNFSAEDVGNAPESCQSRIRPGKNRHCLRNPSLKPCARPVTLGLQLRTSICWPTTLSARTIWRLSRHTGPPCAPCPNSRARRGMAAERLRRGPMLLVFCRRNSHAHSPAKLYWR